MCHVVGWLDDFVLGNVRAVSGRHGGYKDRLKGGVGRIHQGFLKETTVRAKAELANRVDAITKKKRGARVTHPVDLFYLKPRHWIAS